MEYLYDDARFLLSAILVNKSWAAEGISVPWQKPPITDSSSIANGHRQLYARQIRELHFTDVDEGTQLAMFGSGVLRVSPFKFLILLWGVQESPAWQVSFHAALEACVPKCHS